MCVLGWPMCCIRVGCGEILGGKEAHMNKSAFRLILISAMLIQSIGLYAAAPGELNYQGKLADSTGNPLTGSYDFQFQICPSLSGPGCLPAAPLTFTNVAVANGVFNVIVTGVTTDMFPGTGGFGAAERRGSLYAPGPTRGACGQPLRDGRSGGRDHGYRG